MFMKLQQILITASLLVVTITSKSQSLFEEYFSSKGVRYDFELIGDFNSVDVVHKQTKLLAGWGGNPSNLIDGLDYGNYRVQLTNMNKKVLFQQGFSPLFMEYQTTLEAKTRKASYYQAVFFPMPKADVVLKIDNRNSKNEWVTIYTDTLKADNYFCINETPLNLKSVDILKNGSSDKKIDIIVLPEGYTKNEMKKFISDVKRLTDSLFSVEPFAKYKNRFNVKAVKIPSVQSGTDIPGAHVFRNTVFNSHFYTFDSERYLTTSDMKPIYDVLDGFVFDQIYVLVNTEKYGGGGFYNYLNLCSSDHASSPFVFIHEFGHGFGGLGDEYYTSDTAYEEFYQMGSEPWEPNLTTMVDFNLKWKSMVDGSTPIPTPRDSTYMNKIGVFEGGGYVSKGIYSPMMTCWMKEKTAKGFCPVCIKAIENVILKNTR